jgi:hypothetical protein
MNIRKLGALRAYRANVVILLGFALIVAGAWIVIADIFGAVVAAGTGMCLSGVVLLVLQGLSEGPEQ